MSTNPRQTEPFIERAIGDLAAGYGGVMVSLGHKLGLYRALADGEPRTPSDVAVASGCHERYVREWLGSQVAARYVDYDPRSKRYSLSAENAEVLADEDSPVFIPNAWQVPASMWIDEARALEAFRTGDGVPWGEHDGRLYCGVAAFYRNAYRASLVQEWIPALDQVREKLENGASVADIGCGHGHSTIIMAEAFPESRFVGLDNHPDSIEAARENAVAAGVDERVLFVEGAAETMQCASHDLICFFDCLHDMGDPAGALARARRALTEDGTVMLVEPFANDTLEDNVNPVARLYYSASCTLCCAHAMAERGPEVLGAQAGAKAIERIAREGGFRHVRVAVQTPFNHVFELRP